MIRDKRVCPFVHVSAGHPVKCGILILNEHYCTTIVITVLTEETHLVLLRNHTTTAKK